MLFGLSDTEWQGIGAAFVVVLNALIGGGLLWLNGKQDRKEKANRAALDEAFRIIDALRKDVTDSEIDVKDLRKELRQAQKEHETCHYRLARAVARIEHLEDALRSANIPFRPWLDDTAEHKPLPPTGGS